MEIYKELQTPAAKEFEQLLNSQFSKNKDLAEGKVIEGTVTKVSDKFVFLHCEGLKSEPVLDINEIKSIKNKNKDPCLDCKYSIKNILIS